MFALLDANASFKVVCALPKFVVPNFFVGVFYLLLEKLWYMENLSFVMYVMPGGAEMVAEKKCSCIIMANAYHF